MADFGLSRDPYGRLVLTAADGGVTLAARLPEKAAAQLLPDLDRILEAVDRSMAY